MEIIDILTLLVIAATLAQAYHTIFEVVIPRHRGLPETPRWWCLACRWTGAVK